MGLGYFALPLGGSGPPVITFVTSNASPLPLSTPVAIRVYDSAGLVYHRIDVRFPSSNLYEVIHDSEGFGPRYDSGSTDDPTGPAETPVNYDMSVRREGGWPTGVAIISGHALDEDGNLTIESREYTFASAVSSEVTSAASETESEAEVEPAIDLLLDDDGDLAIVDGDLGLARANIAGIGQLVRIACGMFRGEWFLDTEAGIPYFEEVFVKAPDMAAIREWFRREVAAVPGVRSVTRIDLVFDGATRELTINITADTDAGELVETIEVEV